MDKQPILRRPKDNPGKDFWHTLRLGAPIAVLLLLALPWLLG